MSTTIFTNVEMRTCRCSACDQFFAVVQRRLIIVGAHHRPYVPLAELA